MEKTTRHSEEEVSPARRVEMPVLNRRDAGGAYVRLVLGAPADWRSRPGQFINVRCESDPQAAVATERRRLEWREGGQWPVATGLELGRRRWPLVRRPLSVSRLHPQKAGVRLEVLVHTVGPGTHWLAGRPIGAAVDVVGPLGNYFTPPQPGRLAVLVGGGCGMAPIFGLADDLAARRHEAVFILGAPTLEAVPVRFGHPPPATGDRLNPCETVAEPDVPVPTVLATDDGSAGFRGTAVAAAARYVEREAAGRPVALYGCGPEPMLRALADLARSLGAPCQVSLEEFMGCGIGVCLSCVRKMRDPAEEKGWTYRLTCRDGPVVEATDILWE